MRIEDVHSLDWFGWEWSPWRPLDDVVRPYKKGAEQAPRGKQGIYRIRCSGRRGLLYIGQTGPTQGGIRGRFSALQFAIRQAGVSGRPRAPHVAGACVAEHIRRGCVSEISWTVTDGMEKRERLGRECDLIAAHRTALGESPVCQFAGMPDG